MESPIKLFPDSIFTVDDAGEVALLHAPPRTPAGHALRWGWLVPLLAIIATWNLASPGFTALLFFLLLSYPLTAVILANWIFPATLYQAHFDDAGLHLAIGHAQNPTADAQLFSPFEDITALVTLDHYRNMGRYGTSWFRSYIFQTKTAYGRKPHVQINTKRSAQSVHSVLQRLARLPAAQHIQLPPMVSIGNPPSPERLRAEREERQRRLQGEV